MNTKSALTKIAAYALLLLSGCFGAWVAYTTVQRFAVIARAVLGFAVIYLVVQRHLVPTTSRKVGAAAIDSLFEFPSNVQYFIFMFIWCVIGSWAAMQIIFMIFFYIKP